MTTLLEEEPGRGTALRQRGGQKEGDSCGHQCSGVHAPTQQAAAPNAQVVSLVQLVEDRALGREPLTSPKGMSMMLAQGLHYETTALGGSSHSCGRTYCSVSVTHSTRLCHYAANSAKLKLRLLMSVNANTTDPAAFQRKYLSVATAFLNRPHSSLSSEE